MIFAVSALMVMDMFALFLLVISRLIDLITILRRLISTSLKTGLRDNSTIAFSSRSAVFAERVQIGRLDLIGIMNY